MKFYSKKLIELIIAPNICGHKFPQSARITLVLYAYMDLFHHGKTTGIEKQLKYGEYFYLKSKQGNNINNNSTQMA